MIVNINTKTIEKSGLTIAQFYYLLSLTAPISEAEKQDLAYSQYLTSQNLLSGAYFITPKGYKAINDITKSSDGQLMSMKSRVENLAKELQSLFPEGKKPGTNNYWRGNLREIEDRLLAFFKKVQDYPDEVVINATRKYVESFNGNYTIMRTLKYFISKKDNNETCYDLLTWIENADANETRYVGAGDKLI